MTAPTDLPVAAVLPTLCRYLREGTGAVLQAPPGAGKTTTVPLVLADEPWATDRRILMLEPRRLAARNAAAYMASRLGETVGETVGYTIRLDRKVGPTTRVEILTEGILARRLQRDPELTGVAAVIFDEFHERSLHADLGLALCLEAQEALRPDLRLVVMSATLEAEPIAQLMGGVPIAASEGRTFPVDLLHAAKPVKGAVEGEVALAIRMALAKEPGSILAFLPGEAEIRRTAAQLATGLPGDVTVHPLYGALPQNKQEKAIRPAPPNRRKVVLATSIAETSLTIEGIRVIVDSGMARKSRFDPGSGMSRLETVRISRAAAEQRRGRAGRIEQGVCYRLWPKAAEGALEAYDRPEIMEADLAPLALALADWGTGDPHTLRWLDAPPVAAFAAARDLLRALGAIDDLGDNCDGAITAHGRAMAALPLHPRLAHMVLRGRERTDGATACLLAALLEERDVLRRGTPRDTDLRRRVEALAGLENKRPLDATLDLGAAKRVLDQAKRLRRIAKIPDGAIRTPETGVLLATAYPDRIAARRRGGGGRYQLSGGRGAVLPADAPLATEPWLAIADLDGQRRNARIWRAAPVDLPAIEETFGDAIETTDHVAWNRREQAVEAARQRRLGALVLRSEPLKLAGDDERAVAALCEGIRIAGLKCLPWTKSSEALRARIAFAKRLEAGGVEWPDLSEAALLSDLGTWLAPHLADMSRLSDLLRLDTSHLIGTLLDWSARQVLDRLAPSHFQAPSGSRIAIDYGPEQPVLAVRLQEMFGSDQHPSVAGGKVLLVVHLLSPAHRPLQITTDLPGFWNSSYPDVRKDMRGRYPKYPWPEDPLTAAPTKRVKGRR